ncbi:bifunctional oligoribonuclease/PAP phosphatase NrnA [Paenibacillus woosongensis]|uniref:Bifunctional oligoribonuclease/PAP phosphatase NrnA n=1 Tax=Paenibacillus woosongensis TaxID=307580 RepID=A0AA95ICM8_9BACL|nr:bifunctional oligoribonuclease/PAP phosphatase NrnA [Paenibacillus woosongensis]WHX51454.1 bifunctional oligoribonuclease/PAP phosphatase NrnA [Paenibacillus woosongensis]
MQTNEQEFLQVEQFLKDHDDFLVVSHVQPDGDAVSSTLVVGWLLSCLGKNYVMVNEGPIPQRMSYLLHSDRIMDLSVTPLGKTYKHIICVDCADFRRVGKASEYFAPDAEILNIDHHPTNDGFGGINLIVPEAAATVQVLYELVKRLKFGLDRDVATALYTGLLTDTGGFRYSCTSPKVMAIASDLLAYGVDGPGLSQLLLEEMTLAQIRLLTRALNGLQMTEDGKIGWVTIDDEDMKLSGAIHEDLEGIVNYPRNIQGVEVGLLFKVIDDNAVKVSMRSAGKVDVAAVAQSFGGGGHVRAAGVRMQGSLDEVVSQIVEQVKARL